MTDEPLERCICTGLAGLVFEDRPAGGRRVAIGCANCGTRTVGFPLNQIKDAIHAWEAGDFAEGAPTVHGDMQAVRADGLHAGRPRQLTPSRLRF